MKKYDGRIVELAPEEIFIKQDGVEYAEFEKFTYFSTYANRESRVNVLLPPNYSEDKEYPVLYICHGYWDNEDWMARDVVGISVMLSNLYANGEAEEMIVVCPYIFVSEELPYCTGMDWKNNLAYDNFINDLVTDLMPFIEENFSVAKGRENTAITGFSMGGRESLFIGFKRPDLFGYIGSCCAAPGVATDMMKPSELSFEENDPYFLLLSWSLSDSVVGTMAESYSNIMNDNGTAHVCHVTQNTWHDHTSVKQHLYNLCRVIFHN